MSGVCQGVPGAGVGHATCGAPVARQVPDEEGPVKEQANRYSSSLDPYISQN